MFYPTSSFQPSRKLFQTGLVIFCKGIGQTNGILWLVNIQAVLRLLDFLEMYLRVLMFLVFIVSYRIAKCIRKITRGSVMGHYLMTNELIYDQMNTLYNKGFPSS